MRFYNINYFVFVVPLIQLSGCQIISSQMASVGGTEGVSQAFTTTKTAISAPVATAKTTIISMAPDGLVGTAETVSGSVTSAADAVGVNTSDVFASPDSETKAPFSIKGTFNSVMVAVGVKASQAQIAAKEQAQAAKTFAASLIPRNLDLVIETTPDANGDAEGRGLSTIFRFYALQDAAAFAQLTAVEISDKALPYQEQLLLPNRITRLRPKYPSDSQFVGVLFQLHNRPHRWKLLIPVNRLQAGQQLHVVLGRCDANVKTGLVPLPNVITAGAVSPTIKTISKASASTIESALSAVC